MGLRVVFNLDYEDALISAPIIGRVDPTAIKHEAEDPEARARGHPVYEPLSEQWASWAQAITDLRPADAHRGSPGELYVKRRGEPARKLVSPPVPDPPVEAATLAAVEAQYLATYFRPQATIAPGLAQLRHHPESAGRTRRLVPLTNEAA